MGETQRDVTIRDIAERVGVSAGTVSAALTGQRKRVFVSDETRKRVFAAAEAMGYPLERLRAREQQLRRIAVFFPVGPNTVFHATALELCRVLSERGLYVLTHMVDDYSKVAGEAARLYRHHEADGVILIGSAAHYQSEVLRGFPCVVIGELPDGHATWQVVADNEQLGGLVAQHLWTLGHRRVGFAYCASNPLPAERRLRGLRLGWEEAGGAFGPEHVLTTRTDSVEELAETLPAFVEGTGSRRGPLSAVAFWNDWMALAGLRALRASGLRVPEDVSVAGFDDVPFAELADPPLTTVRVPFADLGAMAAEMLEERLRAPEGETQKRLLGGQLVQRQSTAAIAGG